MPYPSTPERSRVSPTTHRFIPNQGWLEYGGHESLPLGPHPSWSACNPPRRARAGSAHLLRSPRGTEQRFEWQPAARTWLVLENHNRSLRAGYTASYLSSHGWQYVGPAAS